MKDEFFDGLVVDQVLVDNAVEYSFVDTVVPNAVGVDDKQRTIVTDAEAGRCAAFDAHRIIVFAKLPEFVGQRAIDAGCFAIGITVAAGADKYVSGIGCLTRCILVQNKFSVELIFCYKITEATKFLKAVFCVFGKNRCANKKRPRIGSR